MIHDLDQKIPKKGEGSNYPVLSIPGIRMSTKEVWEDWVEDGTDTEDLIKVTSDLSQ